MISKSTHLFLLLALFLVNLSYAGVTGKITGRITDQTSNEPLPGVNVVIKGTMMGAATDMEGKFFILNVPPGTYTLSVSMIGYTTKEITNVSVSSDLTTTINIQLSSTVLEMGETVTVVAERPLIQRDATASAAIVSSSEISAAPIESFQEIVQTKAGVTVDRDGALHIRGGRSDEIVYMVDGIANVNPFTNKLGVEVATNAIEELSVISGSFNAEYGQALSGVVNIITKEGSRNYNGSLSFQTGDVVTSHSDIFTDKIDKIDLLNTYETEASFGGPIPGLAGKSTFYLSGRFFDDKGYLYGEQLHGVTDAYDQVLTGDGKIVSMNPNKTYNAQGKISFNITPSFKIQYSGLFDYQKYQSYNSVEEHERKFIVEGGLWEFDRGERHSLKLTHQVSSRTFYTLVGSYLWDKYWYYAFEDPRDSRYVAGWYAKYDSAYEFLNGGTVNSRLKRNSITLAGKLDLTSQITDHHEIKAGFDIKRHDMYQHDYRVLPDRAGEDDNGDGVIGNIIDASGAFNNTYEHNPFEIAGYFQDKIELADMVINAGFRMDYFDPDAYVAKDYNNPDPEDVEEAKTQFQFSPRFSLAYPITDRGKLFFSYGHFFQIPPFYRLYHNPDFDVEPGVIKSDIGNADLEPQKTISYEVGFEQELAADVAMYVKMYYRDIRNLLGQRIYVLPGGSDSYALFINRDFGHVKGINFTLNKRYSNFFSASVDYTFQVAEGNESDPTRTRRNYRLAIEQEKQVVFLDWDQTHALRVNLNFAQANNWGVNLIGKFESGYPYTPTAANEIIRVAEENSGRKIPIINMDFHAYKVFPVKMGSFSTNLIYYIKVFNLFDRLNENYVWDSTGRSGYVIAQYGGVVTPEYANRPYWYSKPRQIFTGLSIEF